MVVLIATVTTHHFTRRTVKSPKRNKPLDRSAREAQEAEAQTTAGEMGDARQSRSNMLRILKENFARENQNEHEAEHGTGRDLGMSD